MKNLRRHSACFKLKALGLSLSYFGGIALPLLLHAQEPPSIPLDFIEGAKAIGLESQKNEGVVLSTRRYGPVRSGWALAVDPNEVVEFTIGGAAQEPLWAREQTDGGTLDSTDRVVWSLPGGAFSRSSDGVDRLRAPSRPGHVRFTMTRTTSVSHGDRTGETGEPLTIELTLLVRAPYDRRGDGMIGGYPIGIYPNEAGRGASDYVRQYQKMYEPPRGFILVTPEVADLWVSEHFRLGDFSARAESDRPHYIALDRRLLELLETAATHLESLFGPTDNPRPLVILVAFVSPHRLAQWRNRGIAIARFTRYQYGDAAAVIWDGDGDGVLDDLNRDGRIDVEDARVLADQFAAVQKQLSKFGGIGTVGSPRLPEFPATPYVDVDMRGVTSRWGD